MCKYDQSDKKSCNNLLIESHNRHNKNVLSPKDIEKKAKKLTENSLFRYYIFHEIDIIDVVAVEDECVFNDKETNKNSKMPIIKKNTSFKIVTRLTLHKQNKEVAEKYEKVKSILKTLCSDKSKFKENEKA